MQSHFWVYEEYENQYVEEVYTQYIFIAAIAITMYS
jgi:hypothetical protein